MTAIAFARNWLTSAGLAAPEAVADLIYCTGSNHLAEDCIKATKCDDFTVDDLAKAFYHIRLEYEGNLTSIRNNIAELRDSYEYNSYKYQYYNVIIHYIDKLFRKLTREHYISSTVIHHDDGSIFAAKNLGDEPEFVCKYHEECPQFPLVFPVFKSEKHTLKWVGRDTDAERYNNELIQKITLLRDSTESGLGAVNLCNFVISQVNDTKCKSQLNKYDIGLLIYDFRTFEKGYAYPFNKNKLSKENADYLGSKIADIITSLDKMSAYPSDPRNLVNTHGGRHD